MIVAFTGIRDLGKGDEDAIGRGVFALLARGVTSMRFGGARGADTVALEAAGDAPIERVVVVPYQVADQPWVAQQAIKRHATRVIELGYTPGDKKAYHIRNGWLVLGGEELDEPAALVLAATDGRTFGGTASTIRMTKVAKIDIEIIPVQGDARRMKGRR